MLDESLETIGLTPNEAKIYNVLLELKEASISKIAVSAGIHRRNVYDTVQRLMEHGLIYQVLPKKVLTYSPVHPDKLKELVDEKTRELNRIMPELTKRFGESAIEQSFYIYRGVGGLKNFINLMIKEGKTIYGIGSKGTWFDKRISSFAKKAEKEYKKKKIKSYLIFDEELKKEEHVFKIIGGTYKFLPKKYCGESSIDIFGDYVAIYSGVNSLGLDREITIFILKDRSLAKDMMKWWRFYWDFLPNQ